MWMQTDAWGAMGGPGPFSGAVEFVSAADVLGAVVGRHGAHLLLLLFPVGYPRLLLLPGACPANTPGFRQALEHQQRFIAG